MTTPLPYFGIDIGKDFIVLAQATTSRHRATWPTVTIKFDFSDWWQQLIALIPNGIVVCEPTGWHLLAPVATVIQHYTPAALWLATHEASAAARQHFASAKTDDMDARALASIAEMIAANDPPRGVKPYDGIHAAAVLTLRLHVNAYARATRNSTRAKNQIEVFLHSVWPSLARAKATWSRLAERGYITPAQIRQAAVDFAADAAQLNAQGWDGRQLRWIDALANTLPPDLPVHPTIIATITEIVTHLVTSQQDEHRYQIALRHLIQQPPFAEVSRRWATIPGVSPEYIAALHVACNGEADQLTTDQFKAVCGVNPKSSQSGQRSRTRLTRKGYRPALNALWTWSMYLTSPTAPDNPIKAYHQRKQDFYATRAKLARLISNVARDPAGYQYRVSSVISTDNNEGDQHK